MIERVLLFGDKSRLGSDEQVAAEMAELELYEKEVAEAEKEAADVERLEKQMARRGRKHLKKL